MAPPVKQNTNVVITTLILAAFIPTLSSIATYIQSRASAATVEKVHELVNSKSDAQTAQIKELIQANKDLASKLAVLEERLRPIPESTKTTTLTDEQLNRLINRK